MNPAAGVRKLIGRITDIQAGPGQLLALFTATVVARNLLESAMVGGVFPFPAFLLHFPAAYVFPMTGLVWMMHLLSGYDLGRLLKLMVFAWTLTLLPPIIDLVAGSGSAIGYFPLDRTNAGHFLLNFFNPGVTLPGTTAGIRIEAALGCLLAGAFTWSVSRNQRLVRGVLTTVVFAPVFLVFFTWPNLVYIVFSQLFPHSGSAQEFYQWHAATYPHVTGSFHYTIFLVDLLPISVLLLWFLHRLVPSQWSRMKEGFRRNAWLLAGPLAGTAAALSASGGALTFADLASIIGALLAGTLVVIAEPSGGWVRMAAWGIAGAAALSVCWETAVLLLAAAALLSLPGPRWLSRFLAGGVLFLVTSSPLGLSWMPAALIPLALAASASALSPRSAGIPLALAALVLGGILRVMSPTAWGDYHTGLTDAFNRNARQDMALPAATAAAGSGGSLLNLARAELATGDIRMGRWAYEVATARGDSSPDALRTGLNLAYAQGRQDELNALLDRLSSNLEEGAAELSGLLLSRAAESGDTLLIGRLMDSYGASPVLLNAYSQACVFQGDSRRAAPYARAASSHPEAQADHIAWAIQLTAGEGGNFDSLYLEGIDRFPGSVEIMSSRIRAPITAGLPPDSPDLVEACLALRPVSPGVLRTCAVWYFESGMPLTALETAERAIAVSRVPDPVMLELAYTSAIMLGDSARASAHSALLDEITSASGSDRSPSEREDD